MHDDAAPLFPDPDEVDGFWNWDKMHAPRPLSPLAQDVVVGPLVSGFTAAMAEFDSPLEMHRFFVHHYYFSSTRPLADPAERAARAERYGATLDRELARIGPRWENEWKPWLIAHAHAERQRDPSTLDDDALVAGIERHVVDLTEKWTIHGRINYELIATARYCDFYTDVLAPADAAEPLDTLQGFHTRSVDASRGIWTLSRRARPHPELVAALDSLSGPTAEVLTALAAVPGGRDFGAELVAYLDEFGWRSDAVYDVGDVTWREEPTVVLRTVARYCNLGDEADPERHFAAALRRRDELVAAARTALADRPNELARFDELYEMARHNLSITEDHAFWIDQTSIALFRRYLQEVGRRLVGRGVIDDIEDVFCLYRAEVEAAMADGVRRAELVAERRAELAAANSVVPPRSLGVPPPPSDDPLIDALRVRLIGAVAPGEPPPPGMLRGICGSPGVVVGTARVVRSLAEAAKLDEGDILVCEMTLPPWVPLFAIAGGVVADTGGVLSHCAIVAREYGLPAVVGTQVGTATIRDGSTIRVDGERGLVELEYEPGS